MSHKILVSSSSRRYFYHCNNSKRAILLLSQSSSSLSSSLSSSSSSSSLSSSSLVPTTTRSVVCNTDTLNHHPITTNTRTLSTTTQNNNNLPYHLIVGMPALSPTMEYGTISSWKVKEGESFIAGDSLAEIETDKATIDFEAQDDGVIAKILKDSSGSGGGGEIKVGEPILITVEDVNDVDAFKDFRLEDSSSTTSSSSSSNSGDDSVNTIMEGR